MSATLPPLAAPTSERVPAAARVAAPDRSRRVRLVLPAVLVGGCVVAAVGVVVAARGTIPAAAVDADLARLLRAMALIKAVLVAAGVGVLAWRVRRPVPMVLGAAYLAGAWVAAGAAAAMWSLVALGAVAVVLHGVGAALLLLVWRDRDFIPAGLGPSERLVRQRRETARGAR